MPRATALLRKVKTLIPAARSPPPSSAAPAAAAINKGDSRFCKADSLRLTQQRCRDLPYDGDRESDSDVSAFTTNPAYAPTGDASDVPSSRSVLTPPSKVARSIAVGERLCVSFNPRVIAVTAEDHTRFVCTSLCSSGKDTRSRLRSLTRVEKYHLYQVREDLKPPGFRCLPVPACPPKEGVTAPRPFGGSSSRARDSLDRKWSAALGARDSLDRKMTDVLKVASLAGSLDLDADADYDSDSDSGLSSIVRNSLDMRRMRSSSLDLTGEEGFLDDLPGPEDEGFLVGVV